MRILIADDEVVGGMVLNRFLSPYASCDVVENGLQAVEAFENAWNGGTAYDAVFLDIVMPRMDGIEALEAIRTFEETVTTSIEARAKIVMVTAYDNYKRTLSAFDLGCDAYIIKPAEPERIKEMMAELGLISQSAY